MACKEPYEKPTLQIYATQSLLDMMNASIDLAALNAATAELNDYRNRHYTAPAHTEEGKIANALNTILPALDQLMNQSSQQYIWRSRFECPVCGEISSTRKEHCPFCNRNMRIN